MADPRTDDLWRIDHLLSDLACLCRLDGDPARDRLAAHAGLAGGTFLGKLQLCAVFRGERSGGAYANEQSDHGGWHREFASSKGLILA